jgi:5'-nucleotidase / UDP-sugar diphosphatase
MKKPSKSLLCLAFLLLFAGPLHALEQSAVHLTVLHLNDLHGHLLPYLDKSISETSPVGGAARLARMIADERAKNPAGTVLLSAGDMFQGSPISNLFHGQSVIAFMNYLKFNAMAIGNHEFDWGQDVLHQLAAGAAFPFLSANIQDQHCRALPRTKSLVVLTRKHLKLAVIGMTTPDTPFTTKPGNVAGLTFREPAEILPRLIREARSRGADLIVILSHLGLDADQQIAEQVAGIDVIVGGHSHTAMTHPLHINETIIVQAGAYGAYLGVLQLKVEASSHKIIDYTGANELRTVLSGPDDPVDENVVRIVDRFNDQIKSKFARVIGETSVDMVRNPHEESNVGDLIGDTLREASGADIAFHNSGGIRADIPRGKITLDQIYTLLPFDNTIVVMDLSGDQIKQILEQNVGFEHSILQISGMTVHYDLTKPFGSRVIKVDVGAQALEPSKTYRVATNDFLAAGGDHYTTFKEGKNVAHGSSLVDALTTYLESHSPVHPEREKRIVFLHQ